MCTLTYIFQVFFLHQSYNLSVVPPMLRESHILESHHKYMHQTNCLRENFFLGTSNREYSEKSVTC